MKMKCKKKNLKWKKNPYTQTWNGVSNSIASNVELDELNINVLKNTLRKQPPTRKLTLIYFTQLKIFYNNLT